MNQLHIASIFALMFTVILLAGCSVTGRSTASLVDTSVGCSLNTKIAFLEIDGRVEACYGENNLYFLIDNLGSEKLRGLRLYLDSDYPVSLLIRKSVRPGGSSQENIDFGMQKIEDIRSLTVSPIVGDAGVICDEAAISIHIQKC